MIPSWPITKRPGIGSVQLVSPLKAGKSFLEALVQAGNATRSPNAAAVSLPGSERIGKSSRLSRIDLRLFTTFCGEIARSRAPNAPSASCSACNSILQ
jgi:hypothetical protein